MRVRNGMSSLETWRTMAVRRLMCKQNIAHALEVKEDRS